MFASVGSCFRALKVAVCVGAVASLAACTSSGSYIWVQAIPVPNEQPQPYTIVAGDLLNVNVYGDVQLTTRGRVRLDGNITVPLLGDVLAAGKPPMLLGAEVEERLKSFLTAPKVVVQVEELHPSTFTLVGEVATQGVYPLPPDTGILQALARGGGLTQFADPDEIYILRRVSAQRIRVTIDQLVENEPHAMAFKLIDGDVLVVR